MMMHQKKIKLTKKTTIESPIAMTRSRRSARAIKTEIIEIKRRNRTTKAETDAPNLEVSDGQGHEVVDGHVATEDQSPAPYPDPDPDLNHEIEVDGVQGNEHAARTIERSVKSSNVTM